MTALLYGDDTAGDGTIDITEDILTLLIGENQRMSYTATPSKDNASFSSSREEIATVTEMGRVYAHRVGKATITGTSNGGTDTCDVVIPVSNLYSGPNGGLDAIAEPTATAEATFTDLIFFNLPKPGYIHVGQVFPVGALPYPMDFYGDGTDHNLPNYTLEWTSSNEDVAKAKFGILEGIGTGTCTITAQISGTNVKASFDLCVTVRPENAEDLMGIGTDYVYDGHALTGGTSADAMHAIYGAITEAKEKGYSGVLFPHAANIYIQPVQLEAFAIPSEFVVDFNFCNVYVDSWHDYVNGTLADGTLKGGAYCMFSFAGAQYSAIRNLNYYGERYNTEHTEAEYGEQTLWLSYESGYYCDVYNCRFEGVTGFHICAGSGNKGVDATNNPSGRNDSCWSYENSAFGKLLEDGTVEGSEIWIYTPNAISFNADFYDSYHYGTSYAAIYGPVFDHARFYNIAFYDADGNQVEYRENQRIFYPYDTPEGAVSYRVTVPAFFLPTKNYDNRMNNCVGRFMYGDFTYCCRLFNSEFVNTASGALSGTGRCLGFEAFNLANSGVGAKNSWGYDMEDGWWCMFGNVYRNNPWNPRAAFAGVRNAVISNGGCNELYIRVVEGTTILDNGYNYLQMSESINAVTDFGGTIVETNYGYRMGNVNIATKEEV